MTAAPTLARSPALPRLVSYSVKDLFGRRDFAFEPAERGLTLLAGANGTGKSTILRTIHASATGRWLELHSLPFESLTFGFDNGRNLRIERREDTLEVVLDANLSWRLAPSAITPVSLDELSVARSKGVRRISPLRYEYEGREYRKRELEHLLAIRDLLTTSNAMWVADIPNWFAVQFITDQRLVLQPERVPGTVPRITRTIPVRLAVNEYANELSAEISRALSQYASQSQNFDRLFPQRVLEAMEGEASPPLEEVKALLEKVADERLSLQRVGLLDRQFEPMLPDDRRLENEAVRQVIATFSKDTLAKFATLDDLRGRLDLFIDFVNGHFERKALQTDRYTGFSIEMPDGSKIRPSDLSSGEQQVLVLAYQVLFESEAGTLILIDEPELSLHVLWQATLVEDLLTMGQARSLSFILATHSPTLVGDREDLIRSLD